MRLELAERLICPGDHARTPLIVIALETADRDLRRGSVGCMTCHREGRVLDGSLEFGAPVTTAAGSVPLREPSEDLLFRLTALLALDDPGQPILVGETYREVAPLLAERFDAAVAVIGAAGASPRGVGHVLGAGERIPFADGCFHAAALDDRMGAAAMADAVRAVRVGGRVLGDAGSPLPPRVRELARDAQHWVGEVQAAPTVVPLRRA
ncbi:MAG TPA: hypothetical protein PLY94_02305 [Gemmatimonadaceae bacterium]|nr:hypothetical protein [Gemmatimonadaceae bacterium]